MGAYHHLRSVMLLCFVFASQPRIDAVGHRDAEVDEGSWTLRVHESSVAVENSHNNDLGALKSAGLLHPSCKHVAWRNKVKCENGVNPENMLDIVRTRHVETDVVGTKKKDAAESAILKAHQRSRMKIANSSIPVRHRAVILMSGLIARDEGRYLRCTPRGRAKQLQATRSQIDHLITPLASNGFSVHLFLSTSDCVDGTTGANFTSRIQQAYGTFLTSFHASSCIGAPFGRCLIKVQRRLNRKVF